MASSDPSSFYFYCSNPQIRYNSLFQGRPIQLSESSLQTLEQIASHGRRGITQAELAKSLGCDSKNAFHWLKSLISNDLIARTPVASKKSFTYLLTLTKFLDEDLPTSPQISQTHTIISSKEIRQRIVEILAKVPNQTMVSKDVFAETGLDRQFIKNFRRAATKLNEIGWLEYLFEDQLIGPCCRLFRLKRKPSEGLDLKSFLALREENKKLEIKPVIPRGSDFKPDHPVIHQIILLLSHSFPESMTTSELSHSLNIPRKYLYKLIDRILPFSDNKIGVIGAEGVGKVSDFVGKEKRLKLFIKSEFYRDFYIKMFSTDLETVKSSSSSPVTSNLEPPVATPLSKPVPSTSQSPSSSQTSTPRSETRTRQIRHQAILQELSERKVLEVCKDLCARIQARLGDTRFTLDVKTLRRSVEILEREGSLKVVITTVPLGTRTLLLSPELSVSDQFVQDYISKLSEYVRTGSLSASTQKIIKLKELMLQPDFFVEGSLPLGIPQNPSINLQALLKFGFIYGVLARSQLFHQYLLTQSRDSCFETIPVAFERLPLDLYLKLIGTVRLSKEIHDNLNDLLCCQICDLPENFKEELSLNRKRFQSQIAMLLQTLEQLQLIKGEDQYESLNFKLPFKYNFSVEVPVYNYDGKIKKILKSTDKKFFDEFWNEMKQISIDFQNRNVSIYDEIEDLTIPKPIILARYSASWKQRPSRERDLERSLKKLLMEYKKHGNINLEISLNEISNEFEVPIERVEKMFENFETLLEERTEAKRLDNLAKKRKSSVDDNSSDNESDDEDEIALEHLRWTSTDWQKLSLAFVILQQQIFLTGGTGIKWNLAAQIFDKPKSPIIIRRHGLKLFKSYEELRKLLEIDTIVQLVIKTIELPEDHDGVTDLSQVFENIYNACQSEILNINDSNIFDQFTQEPMCVLESRQDHYLNTIDSWVQTRSFRHGLILNNPGLIKEKPFNSFLSDQNVLLLRQVLVYSYLDTFDYDQTLDLLKSIPSEALYKSIDHLVSTNFASKNKARDKNRLFGEPLVISESVRSVIEYTDNVLEERNLRVTNETETLNINKIESIIDSIVEGKARLTLERSGDLIKFDAPVEIVKADNNSTLNIDKLNTVDKAIWLIPGTSELLHQVAFNCLAHLQKTIKSFPGISIDALKFRYENILEGFEVEALISCLIFNQKIKLLSSKYLQ